MKKVIITIIEEEEERTIVVGDVVRLKSGSPRMTVDSVTAGGDVWCKWFVGKECKMEHFCKGAVIEFKEKPNEK